MLTHRQLLNLKPKARVYSITDDRRLSIEVTPAGLKRWVFRYQFNGKTEKIILGRHPAMSLAEARVERDKLAVMVDRGESPAQQKRQAKSAHTAAATLREFAEVYYQEGVLKDRKNPVQMRRYLDKDIFPFIGTKRVSEVVTEDIRKLIWRKKDHGHDAAAADLRGLLKRLFDYAVTHELVQYNPVLALPMRHVFKPKARDRVLSAKEIQAFLRAVYHSSMRRQFKLALHLILITMVRKSELLLARWEHIDLDAGVWEIPSENSKTGKPHLVYLSIQAKELLSELYHLAGGSAFVLPGRSSLDKPFSHNALNKALLQAVGTLDIPAFTIHDLRRTSSTMLHENGWPSDVVEKALNHTIIGVRGVYNRAEYAEQRREMLQFWAGFVGTLVDGGKVVMGNFRKVVEQ